MALLLAMAGGVPGAGAEAAMGAWRAILADALPTTRCDRGTGGEIVVCARSDTQRERLPLRDERAAIAEIVRHPGEPARAGMADDHPCHRVGCTEPSRAPATWRRVMGLLAGEDPD